MSLHILLYKVVRSCVELVALTGSEAPYLPHLLRQQLNQLVDVVEKVEALRFLLYLHRHKLFHLRTCHLHHHPEQPSLTKLEYIESS